MADVKAIIAKRVAKELKDGNVVNLGIGLPTLVVDYLPEDAAITFQSENGIMGMGPAAESGKEDLDIMNAGAGYVTANPGAMFFDSATSFGIIRGGHVDVTVLGALQVDRHGNLASWIIPGKMVPGMGGSMDLVVGAKKVIIAMQHTQKGSHKILDECTLPYTAVGVVDDIVTGKGDLMVTPEGLLRTEYNTDCTVEQIQEATGATLNISGDLTPMF